ncbi:hypothetical protein [Brevundimonas sp.]|uniref:DUF7146 domain-containing protein n=1 Tax=Brevundimonas sp. TaxID=1871086 RepID=UPI00260A88E8|nr:hypothetical protein [Brevundimonas sp.]
MSNLPQHGRPPEITVREISTMLADRIDRVCAALGLDGHIVQGGLLPLNPTRHDRKPGSFVIQLSGTRQGRWDEYATGEYGDALDLVAYVNFGGWPISREAKAEALRWGKRFIGIGDHTHMDPKAAAKLKAARETMEENTARAEALALSNRDKDRRGAQRMFLEAQPLEPGLPGYEYLREARELDLSRLERLPWAVRSHHAMRHVECDRFVPCLISAMMFPDGTIAAVHRVFLEPGGKGKLEEAVRHGFPTKKIWPRGWHGAVIPISRGRTGLSPRRAAEAGLADECGYWEGVENSFGAAILIPEWRISAVGASANFAHVEPAVSATAVIAGRDRDKDRKVLNGVTAKVDELRAKCEARDLPFMESWPERGFKDVNDMLRGVRS